MTNDRFNQIYSEEVLSRLLPESRSDEFFEALYGDTEEGAYDIRLAYVKADENTLEFELQLKQRPGKCLACNLTYGLPDVFKRHPLINLNGIVKEIENLAGDGVRISGWKLGRTKEKSRQLHTVPLILSRETAA
jgi:hypothetical protein